nr:DUF6017 domain-containing protein [Listeria kieliensis]
MAVFRVEKNKGYTVMSNHHLRNKDLTLKAKGLLSQMLSLPESWDYTLAGLSFINKESIDAIRTAVLELEKAGYITRRQGRDPVTGKMAGIEYTIYEQPQKPPSLENPISDKPIPDNPASASPASENPTEIITDEVITDLTNTDLSSTHPSIHPESPVGPPDPEDTEIDRKMDAIEIYRQIVYENIEFEHLCHKYDRDRLTEIAELIVETVCSERKRIRIGGEDKPAEVVKSRLMKLGQFHIEYVFDCLEKNTTKIRNIRSYLLTTLYNAPLTSPNAPGALSGRATKTRKSIFTVM